VGLLLELDGEIVAAGAGVVVALQLRQPLGDKLDEAIGTHVTRPAQEEPFEPGAEEGARGPGELLRGKDSRVFLKWKVSAKSPLDTRSALLRTSKNPE
jgi:hypothetical protein